MLSSPPSLIKFPQIDPNQEFTFSNMDASDIVIKTNQVSCTDLHNSLLFFLDRIHNWPDNRVQLHGKFIEENQSAGNTCLNPKHHEQTMYSRFLEYHALQC